MLPTRKSVPRSSRQSDHTKTSWPSWRDANCSGSGQDYLARQSERGKKTRRTKEDVGRHQGVDRPGVRQVPEGSSEQEKKWKKLVARSSVVLQRPSRLRDWRWWWWLPQLTARYTTILSFIYFFFFLFSSFTKERRFGGEYVRWS